MKRFFYCIIFACIAWNIVNASPFRERIYVQTDKQLYLAGERIRMKVLTINAEQIPVDFSKVAYAELVCDSVARAQIKVELINGAGEGRMQLPVDLPSGYYRLIAYTQFMRNEGPEVFFEKNIAVANTFQSGYQPVEQERATESDTLLQESFAPANLDTSVNISLQPDKKIYTTREHGELILSGLPENIHTLSVSITGKEWMPVAESDVSLFRKNQTKKSLTFTGVFLPEYEGHIVKGKIIDNLTSAVKTDNDFLFPVLTFLGEGLHFFSGQKNKTGDVQFVTTGISETKEIATEIFFADGKYRVDIQSPFVTRFTPKPMPQLHIDTAYYGRLLERSVALQVLNYFSDESSDHRIVSESYFKMKPSMSYKLDEYTRFTTMQEVFTEFIFPARFRRNGGKWEISTLVKRGNEYSFGTSPLVLLDGVPVSDHDVIYNYNPLAVERINIYYGPCFMGGYRFDGIVELITYRRLHQDLTLNKSTQIISYEGPQSYQRFDTPDYSDENNRKSPKPDARHTLLWNPDVRTDGKTFIRLPFDTSDLTGEFQATVEGVTKDGKIIFITSVFKVER